MDEERFIFKLSGNIFRGVIILAIYICFSFGKTVHAESLPVTRSVASGRNDVVYLSPAIAPYEAMPLGNGRLGVMVSNRKGMTYKFNPGSFFASYDQNLMLYSSGDIQIELPAAWQAGFVEQRLDLYDGLISTEFKRGKDRLKISSWIAEGLDLLVVRISSNRPLPEININLSLWERKPPPWRRPRWESPSPVACRPR